MNPALREITGNIRNEGREVECSLIVARGFREALFLREKIAPIGPRIGIAFIEDERPVEASERLIVFFQLDERHAAVVPRGRVLGTEDKIFLISCRCVGKTRHGKERVGSP